MKIFVYGTLKSDCRNNDIMKKVEGEFLFPCSTTKPFPMFDLGNGFPFLQNKSGYGNIIEGELWKVPNSASEVLNEFEGVPTLYKNGSIEVEFENKVISAYCYFITDELNEEELKDVELLSEWVE